MDTISSIKNRRSIRSFLEKEVPTPLMEEIVDIAKFSPSWKNTGIARYTLIKDKALLKDIAENALMDFSHNENIVKNAPALIVVSYIKGRCGYEKDGSFTTSKGDRWQMFDCGIATQSFSLAAHTKGLGSVIMGIFDEKEIAKRIALPEAEEVAALIAIGYPAEKPTAPKRKETKELIRVID